MNNKGWTASSWDRKSQTNIKVPERMLQAVYLDNCPCSVKYKEMEKYLEAALRWLSENGHTLLNDVELKEISDEWESDKAHNGKHFYRWVIKESLRCLFLASEPERDRKSEITNSFREVFPVEEGYISPPFRDSNQSVAEVDARIPDLLFNSPTHVTIQTAEDRIRRAYRRGHKDGSK